MLSGVASDLGCVFKHLACLQPSIQLRGIVGLNNTQVSWLSFFIVDIHRESAHRLNRVDYPVLNISLQYHHVGV